MSVAIARFAATPSTPWKNGLGTTTQLAIHPAGATANTFEWRISIAALFDTAPFSSFPGIERSLAMLEGAITLLRATEPAITLTPTSPPFVFSGSESITSRVETGTALDLNLMYRPARWHASMRKMALQEPMRLSADVTMLCALEPMRIAVADRRISLERYDLLHTANMEVVALSQATAYAIELRERQ